MSSSFCIFSLQIYIIYTNSQIYLCGNCIDYNYNLIISSGIIKY